MKKITNYAPGPRGITLLPESKNSPHETLWVEPGASVSVDPKRIVEPLPDFGAKPLEDDTVDQVEALTARNSELERIVGEQGEQIAKLTNELEKATKPAG